MRRSRPKKSCRCQQIFENPCINGEIGGLIIYIYLNVIMGSEWKDLNDDDQDMYNV